MVNFRKRLAKTPVSSPSIPQEIYESLDRASDKGPLRDVQEKILDDWYSNYRNKRDVVLKLHTGQGKTLIGLLILQSKINDGKGPALYLCPNNHLVKQTVKQANQFGISVSEVATDLPESFLDGKSILITSAHKLFNGLTKFRLGINSVRVQSIVIDDAHACVDAVRESLKIRIDNTAAAYRELLDLFSEALPQQGAGTFADILKGNLNSLLSVPYWEWQDNEAEVVRILAKYSESTAIKFSWPLLKDMINGCQCVISGTALEISPYLPPLQSFGTYSNAEHRVFMSATVTNDSFLVKGFGLSRQTIINPLKIPNEKWSGEKMILIPSLIHESLQRNMIVQRFAEARPKAFGIVALTPSFGKAKTWEPFGARIADKDSIDQMIDNLVAGNFESPVVIANRYDGIDLPDKSCRILIFDSKPYSDDLIDRYSDGCRTTSDVTTIRIARTIEQGLGRSVRGEKDYSVIVITGSSLVRNLKSHDSQKHLSNQTRKQIEIGLNIAEMAQEDIDKGTEPFEVIKQLINQSLGRNEDWKAFYVEQMNTVSDSNVDASALTFFETELEAERKFRNGDIDGAIGMLQKLVNNDDTDDYDKGWYLQEIARYFYANEKVESNKLQIKAHRLNRFLLKPRSGMTVKKISTVSQKRMENIISWISAYENYDELRIVLDDLLGSLRFGVRAERFEGAFNDLAFALGFIGERPDKEWKEGPDNLWALQDNEYLVVECKNEVDLIRNEIHKDESDQMNQSCAWFRKNYEGAAFSKILIIPTPRLANSAAFYESDVRIMDRESLGALVRQVKAFFSELKNKNFRDLSEKFVQELINTHKLTVLDLQKDYSIPFVTRRP